MTRAVSFRFFESQLTHAHAHKTKWQNECRIGDWESDSSFRLSPPHPFQSCRLYLELTAPQNTLLIQQCAFVQEKYWNVEDNHTLRREFLDSPSSSSPSIISLYKYVSRTFYPSRVWKRCYCCVGRKLNYLGWVSNRYKKSHTNEEFGIKDDDEEPRRKFSLVHTHNSTHTQTYIYNFSVERWWFCVARHRLVV